MTGQIAQEAELSRVSGWEAWLSLRELGLAWPGAGRPRELLGATPQTRTSGSLQGEDPRQASGLEK